MGEAAPECDKVDSGECLHSSMPPPSFFSSSFPSMYISGSLPRARNWRLDPRNLDRAKWAGTQETGQQAAPPPRGKASTFVLLKEPIFKKITERDLADL